MFLFAEKYTALLEACLLPKIAGAMYLQPGM
jgi:hypothetical protein